MTIWQSIILAILQGLTEFLPVSSSGHLVIFQKLIGIANHDLAFDVVVHMGTLCAVFTVYFSLIKQVILGLVKTSPSAKSWEWSLLSRVVIASIPTGIIGLSFKDTFESLFSNVTAVGVGFLITGSILYLTKSKSQQPMGNLEDLKTLQTLSARQAFLIGLGQSVAITPGISRSGTTIATGILIGVPRNTAAMFSFMIAIPAILGAAVLELPKIQISSGEQLTVLIVGLVTSYVFGLLGLKGVIHFVRRGRLELFSYYLWILGILTIFWGRSL